MNNSSFVNKLSVVEMNDKQFDDLSRFIYEYSGILIPDKKRVMLNGRLKKRMKEIGENSIDKYISYLFSENGKDEVVFFIDHVTTNKTFFFRENSHFQYLTEYLSKNWRNSRPH